MHKPTYYLTDAYVEMLGQYFGDVCKDCQSCGLEFQISHWHLMSSTQKRAIAAFNDFWGALEDLDREKGRNDG